MAQKQSTGRQEENERQGTHMWRMCLLTTKSKDSTEVNLSSAVRDAEQTGAGGALVHVDAPGSFYINGEALHVVALV
jgi:hypothetical protein